MQGGKVDPFEEGLFDHYQAISQLALGSPGEGIQEGVFQTLLQNFESSYEESLE